MNEQSITCPYCDHGDKFISFETTCNSDSEIIMTMACECCYADLELTITNDNGYANIAWTNITNKY